MARKRYQRGFVYLDGNKWKGRFREDVIAANGETKRVRREVILGTTAKGDPLVKYLPTKRLAQRQMESVLSRINGFDYRPSRVATFAEFVERWKREILTKQQPSSARAVRSHLKCYILPLLQGLQLEQLTPENQQVFITRALEKGISRKTVLNILGTLASILSTARDWGYTCHPVEFKKLRLPPREQRYEAPHFTADQLRNILAIAEEPWRTLFCILTMEGLRAGEALGLQWGDVDFDRQLLHIRRSAWYGKIQTTKTRASETVLPIPTALLALLQEYRTKWTPNPQGFLFVTRNGRPPSSNKVVEYRLWTVLDALGIPRCGLHAFRHTHTALLLDSGANAKVIQQQLRHADARTTLQIYGHVVGEAQREAVEKLASSLELDANGRRPPVVN